MNMRDNCKLLVEQILNENLLDANKLLADLVVEAQKNREKNILKALISEADEDAEEDDLAEDEGLDEEEDLDDADADTEDGAEPEGGEANLGENLADEDEDENTVGNGKLDEMTTELGSLNHKLNKAKIAMLYNKISTLKSKLNALGLDKDEMQYIELDTKLSFYSEVLENLQQRSMPGIEGEEQSAISEKISIVNDALKGLEADLSADETDEAETEAEAETEEEADVDADTETEEEEAEDDGEEEAEETEDETESEDEVEEEEENNKF